MTPVRPHELAAFVRRYRFPGGKVRAVRLRYTSSRDATVEFRLAVTESIQNLGTEPQPVRLRLRLTGVEEFRVQMRPSLPRVKIGDARLSHLNGLFWVNFDAWGLEPGEQPQPLDFRGSETYAAGRELYWEEVPK